ncbi:hypothetical protein HaLaN_18051, partial [Haematococcus lacustris]
MRPRNRHCCSGCPCPVQAAEAARQRLAQEHETEMAAQQAAKMAQQELVHSLQQQLQASSDASAVTQQAMWELQDREKALQQQLASLREAVQAVSSERALQQSLKELQPLQHQLLPILPTVAASLNRACQAADASDPAQLELEGERSQVLDLHDQVSLELSQRLQRLAEVERTAAAMRAALAVDAGRVLGQLQHMLGLIQQLDGGEALAAQISELQLSARGALLQQEAQAVSGSDWCDGPGSSEPSSPGAAKPAGQAATSSAAQPPSSFPQLQQALGSPDSQLDPHTPRHAVLASTPAGSALSTPDMQHIAPDRPGTQGEA